MDAVRIVAIMLMMGLGLIYGSFSYTKDASAIKHDAIELSLKNDQQATMCASKCQHERGGVIQ